MFSDAPVKSTWGMNVGTVSSGETGGCQAEALTSTATLFKGASEMIPSLFFH